MKAKDAIEEISMIRKLNIKDNEKLMKLVKDEPEFNLYIIGDIENFGYEQEFLEFFGEFNDELELKSVLVRFFSIFMVYAKEDFDVERYADLIKNNGESSLVGKTEIVSKFVNSNLELYSSELHCFAVLKRIDDKFKVDKNLVVKRANLCDVLRIVSLRNKIKEF